MTYSTKSYSEIIERFFEIQELMRRVLDLVEEREHVWLAFADSKILVADSDVSLTQSHIASHGFTGDCYIINACNPFEEILTYKLNRDRNQHLREILERRTSRILDVIGSSQCLQWQEESFLVYEIEENELLKIARMFGQRAVF